MRAILCFVVFLSGAAAVAADGPASKPAEIPLAIIHALNMPGTKPLDPIESHEGEYKTASGPFIKAIYLELPKMKQPRAGFFVPGQGEDAVQEAERVIVGKQEPRTIRAGQRASVVFFSKPFGAYVHLRAVTIENQRITIAYRFVPHEERQVTAHFAVIPLPELPAGKYEVKLAGELDEKQDERVPGNYVKQWEPQIVCRPFEFTIAAKK